MSYKKIIVLITIALSTCFLYSINEKAGTNGFAFLKLNYSARAMGLANAFSALSNDADAVFFNTAGLAQNKQTHIKTTYLNYIDGMHGGSVAYTGNYKEDWKIAPFIQFMVSDDIPKTFELNGNYGGQSGTFNTSHIVAGVGFAKTLHEVLDFGFNIKYLHEKLDSYVAAVIAADLSVLHQTNNENVKVGLVLKNFGKQLSYFTDSKYNENLPTMAIAGVSYKYLDKGFINLDLCRPFDNDFFGRLGMEYYYNTYLTFRTGLDSRMNDYRTDESMDFMSGLAFGLGFNWNEYVIDYAISSMGSLGFVNQISISYKF